jgi:ribonuclease HI
LEARARELGVARQALVLDLIEREVRKAPAAPLPDLFSAATDDASPEPAAAPRTPRSHEDAAWRIWSDGACSGNPGPGGWGTIVEGPEGRQELSGGYRLTTNNRMEMMGAISGLEAVPRGGRVLLTTDSRYVVDALEKKWLAGWKRKGWRKADGGPVANVDLWQRLEAAMAGKFLRLEWVKGHAGHRENERCDQLAVAASHRKDLPADPG